jgi:site-specific DNA recombinase
MRSEQKPILHCAVYTRKSSEEGLEQSFNSLEAQREACEAFILSQKQEGWRVVSTRYDDGGFSGGTLQRPALQELLKDVEAGKVNVIVVYKVDRLTRSLADFAKIVEALDSRGVSFVSVTQQFNTSSSMGRLTLNVLLSFAQFEREVTGERIRDKIAASKKKGMWMGGIVPVGYDLRGRKLVPNSKEAALVRKIFNLYLEEGCVSKLALRLDRDKIRSKVWTSRDGTRHGGVRFARGALYSLLRNRIYIGEIRHRDNCYPGEHERIVPPELWDKVQARLNSNFSLRRNSLREKASSLLTGLLYDKEGNRLTPAFTIRRGRRYRYYISKARTKSSSGQNRGPVRLPAREIESHVERRLQSFLKCDADIFEHIGRAEDTSGTLRRMVTSATKLATRWPTLPSAELRGVLEKVIRRIVVQENRVELLVSRPDLHRLLDRGEMRATEGTNPKTAVTEIDLIHLTIQARMARHSGELHLMVPPSNAGNSTSPHIKAQLVKAVARAHSWYQKVLAGGIFDQRSLAKQVGLTERYVGKVFQCAFLAPEIVEAILEGRQPQFLTFEKLCRHIPLSWAEQRRQFGFA